MAKKYKELNERQVGQLNDIEALIMAIATKEDADEEIRELAVSHKITKSYMTKTRRDRYSPETMAYINDLNDRIWQTLEPVYDFLTNTAFDHMHQWFKRVMKERGVLNPELYEYQAELCKWLLEAIIKNEMPDALYTLLVSRGAGKTWSLSVVGAFLLLHHDSYILHNRNPDYVEIICAPQDKQLQSFKNYIKSFIDTSNGIGIISDKMSETSELNLVLSKNNTDEINLKRMNGSVYSIAYFALGAESVESKHGNLLLSDESKFLTGKAIRTSMLPCVGGRGGQFVMLSSAHDTWSAYQDFIEKNMIADREDNEDKGTRCIITGSTESRNLCFNGRRHFQQHWDRMVDHNDEYAMTVDRALESVSSNREDPSFATQYDNIFLSKKSSSFFDINELSELGIFKYYNPHEFINNPKYCIVAGWDVAVTGDVSDLTIKAIENGFGLDRKSHTLFRMVMNPSKSKQLDSTYNQVVPLFKWLKIYGVSAIAIDESGVGKSTGSYLSERMRSEMYSKLMENNIFSVVFNAKNRFEILEHYYNRMQSGLEIFPEIPEAWKNDEELRNIYIALKDSTSEEACWARFVHEHVRFGRAEILNERTDMMTIDFRQTNERYIHDDSIFGSALASACLLYNPNVHSTGGKPVASSMSKAGRYKRSWKGR